MMMMLLMMKMIKVFTQGVTSSSSSLSCNVCNCNRIEDETHFLLDCPSFSSIRDMFFSKLEPKIPFLRLQSHESLLSHLMNSTDYFINIQLISFISTCFELRDKLISGIINPTDG